MKSQRFLYLLFGACLAGGISLSADAAEEPYSLEDKQKDVVFETNHLKIVFVNLRMAGGSSGTLGVGPEAGCSGAGCEQPFYLNSKGRHDRTKRSTASSSPMGCAHVFQDGSFTFWATGHTFVLEDKGKRLTLEGQSYPVDQSKKTVFTVEGTRVSQKTETK